MSEKKEYVKLWLSYECYFEPYSDVEVGRLVRAMMKYKSSGEEPRFSGNERYVWPAIKRDIDEASAAQELLAEKSRENGKKGGRPKKQNPEKPAGFYENPEKARTKDKDKVKDKGQGQYSSYAPTHTRPPTFEQVLEVAKLNRCPELAKPFFDYYNAANWRDSEGRPVYSWQQKFQAWKMREERRQPSQQIHKSWTELATEMDQEDDVV